MKKIANQERWDVKFQVDDWVFLKIRPYRQSTLRQSMSEKLSSKFFGLHRVLERIGVVAYWLELPPSTTIHPVFHVFQLKKGIGTTLGGTTFDFAFVGNSWMADGTSKNFWLPEESINKCVRGFGGMEGTTKPWRDVGNFWWFQVRTRWFSKGESNIRPPNVLKYSRRVIRESVLCVVV